MWRASRRSLRRLVVGPAVAALTVGPAVGLEWVALGRGLPESGQWRQAFDVADLNGDGALDILHGPPRRGDGKPVVFLGDGDGNFRPWREARFPDLPFDYGAAVAADFSGDGTLDAAFGSHLRGLTVLKGDGKGTFERWDKGLELGTSGTAFSSRALAVIDWNADGRQDLVALGEGPSPGGRDGRLTGSWGLRVLLNEGDGSWTEREAADPGRIFGYSLALAHRGDDQPTVVTSSRSQGQLEVVHSARAAGLVARGALPGVRPGSVLHAVATLDVDRDGLDEVVGSYAAKDESGIWRSGVDLYLSKPPKAGLRQEILALEEVVEISVVAAGDLDADGVADLVAAGVAGHVWVFGGRRNGEFEQIDSSEIERSAAGCKASHARLVDLDGRSGDELVISFSGEPGGAGGCPSGGSVQVWTLR